jgi:hypothetical protein
VSLRSLARTVGIALACSLLTLVVLLGGLELFWRATTPFLEVKWPARFDPRVGFDFEPGSTVQWTNHVDFWAVSRANALGFLDREPPTTRDGGCRVLFVGDSFVEAAQVTLEERVQLLFEQRANAGPGPRVRTMALGYSGTGQANQLPFIDVLGADFAPDLVVLVVVGNDFANNSPVLEGLRNGWSPDATPRYFLRAHPDGIRPLEIAPDWSARRLVVPEFVPDALQRAHAAARTSSYLYAWLYAHLGPQYPALAATLTDPPARAIAARMAPMAAALGDPTIFEGWRYPDDTTMDWMFYAPDPLPRVFEQALRETDAAIGAIVALGAARGFRVVALGTSTLRPPDLGDRFGRPLDPELGVRRWRAAFARHGVPWIDQGEHAAQLGVAPEALRCRRDAHWSAEGHRVAAEATYAWFAGADVCRGR